MCLSFSGMCTVIFYAGAFENAGDSKACAQCHADALERVCLSLGGRACSATHACPKRFCMPRSAGWTSSWDCLRMAGHWRRRARTRKDGMSKVLQRSSRAQMSSYRGRILLHCSWWRWAGSPGPCVVDKVYHVHTLRCQCRRSPSFVEPASVHKALDAPRGGCGEDSQRRG